MSYDHWKTTEPDWNANEERPVDDEPLRCPGCGALTNDDGMSIDVTACFHCKAD